MHFNYRSETQDSCFSFYSSYLLHLASNFSGDQNAPMNTLAKVLNYLYRYLNTEYMLHNLGLGEHAHFSNFGMAFLTLFRVATGDNWNGIMKDTLRDDCDDAADCVKNCCVSAVIAPIFFVIFVLMAQFVLVNVVVAVSTEHWFLFVISYRFSELAENVGKQFVISKFSKSLYLTSTNEYPASSYITGGLV